jgi:hypothetical protein
LLILEDDGELVVAEANPAGLTPARRYKVAQEATWAQPAIVGNRVYVKDLTSLALWTIE